jgi:N utilization substance protein B
VTEIRGSRTKARKRALDILYEVELREIDAADALLQYTEHDDPPLRPYTVELVEGVELHRDTLDERLSAALPDDWTLRRMPRVDRNLARIAAWEIIYGEVDPAVAIAEAVSLAAELSTDESPAFLNGVLSGLQNT